MLVLVWLLRVDVDACVDGADGLGAAAGGAGGAAVASGRGTAYVVRVWLASGSAAVLVFGGRLSV